VSLGELTNEKSNQHGRGRLEGAPGCDGEIEEEENESKRKEGYNECERDEHR